MLNINTQVILLNSSLVDYKNQLSFSSLNTQINYFASKELFSFDNLLYVDSNRTLKLPIEVDRLNSVNYIMYRNIPISNKWYFGFVTSKRFLSKGSSIIDFELDSFQSYQFDFEILKSFVVREHVTDDTLGLHTIDEGFVTGELITNATHNTNLFNDWSVIVQLSYMGNKENGIVALPSIVNNVLHGTTSLVVPLLGAKSEITRIILDAEKNGTLDTILSMYMLPSSFLTKSGDGVSDFSYIMGDCREQYISTNLIASIKGYTPRNNKLLCYPFTSLIVDNNQGNIAEFKFEWLKSNNFKCRLNPSQGGNVTLFPQEYDNVINNGHYQLTMGNFPICSWTGNAFANWSSKTQNSRALTLMGSGLAIGGSVVSGNVLGVAMGSMGIMQSLASTEERKVSPSQSNGNISNNGGNLSLGLMDYTFLSKCITSDKAKAYDDFLTMYGYKVNETKVPNYKTRSGFNYIQTQNVNIIGNMDNKALKDIKQMFDNGVTIWHNPSNFINYSINNEVITNE
ncbi:MAG: hypothetical protein RR500_04885 [Bacilli bacterium]